MPFEEKRLARNCKVLILKTMAKLAARKKSDRQKLC